MPRRGGGECFVIQRILEDALSHVVGRYEHAGKPDGGVAGLCLVVLLESLLYVRPVCPPVLRHPQVEGVHLSRRCRCISR